MNLNRRQFLKKTAFGFAAVAATPFIGPKVLEAGVAFFDNQRYRLYYFDGDDLEGIHKFINKNIYYIHKKIQTHEKVKNSLIVVSKQNHSKLLGDMQPPARFSRTDLLDKGIGNFIIEGIPVIKGKK